MPIPAQAIAAGAAAILAPAGTVLDDLRAVLVAEPEPRRAFALAAARFFGAQPEVMAAVTGTNGKTSTVTFCRQMWTLAGHRAASLGTLGVSSPGLNTHGGLTTPDPAGLHRLLADLARDGISHAALEASSHGLDQHRLDGLTLRAAAFTNLTRDHLDYHHDMDSYARAKLRLFQDLLPSGAAAVVNADADPSAGILDIARARGLRVLRYGTAGVELRLDAAHPTPEGQDL
ncbi:MAG: UDP-N-acetylmuramoyl-L-alanyl-D-glutamate--2,6-diaminopimelate ligase, partial [Rhodospirillales bacterium]|nr:UDP-N-acetylmuramoyl-L-alanyl-D-glutamate--2,6-diaminopimelate ligase [Rhodospirillales bacterium]